MEWIEYHMLIGVGFFYVISHDCSATEDAVTSEALLPYVSSGRVLVDRAYQVCGCVGSTSACRLHAEYTV